MGLNIAYIGLTLCRAIVFNIPSQLVKERIVKNRCLQLMVEKYLLGSSFLMNLCTAKDSQCYQSEYDIDTVSLFE